MLLEGGDRDAARLPLLFLEFGVVEVPEHLEVDEVGRDLGQHLLVDRREIERDRLGPQRLEPCFHTADERVLVMAEHQLQVGVESPASEVRGAGEDAALLAAEEEGLGVEEVPLVAPHLDPAGAQELEEIPDGPILGRIEGQKVPVAAEAALELPQPLLDAPPGEFRLRGVVGRAAGCSGLRCRVRAEEKPDPGHVPCLVGDEF